MLDYLWIVIAGGITSFTAAMGIGANDVANAIGPFAAMWAIYNSTDLSKKNEIKKV